MWVNQQIFHISIKCYSCSCEHVWDKCSCLETIFAIKQIHCSVQETETRAIISKVRQSSKMLMKCDLWVCQANKMWNMMRVSVFEQLRQKKYYCPYKSWLALTWNLAGGDTDKQFCFGGNYWERLLSEIGKVIVGSRRFGGDVEFPAGAPTKP